MRKIRALVFEPDVQKLVNNHNLTPSGDLVPPRLHCVRDAKE